MIKVILKPGRDKSVLRRHPWIFTGAIEKIDGKPSSGETVIVCEQDGKPLAIGAFSPVSQIAVRIWTWNPEEEIGPAFFRQKIGQAAALRKIPLIPDPTDAYRLVYSESDGLPGLIADRFGGHLVCQFSSAGAEFWKKEIISAFMEYLPWAGIYERSDVGSRRLEGLPEQSGLLAGSEPDGKIRIIEAGRIIEVDITGGQKTGYYLDQRDNRTLVGQFACGLDVLDCYSYTGGFSIAASINAAKHVTMVDSSAAALEQARRNIMLNGIAPESHTSIEADVPKALRKFRDEGRKFGMIILDPPKFVESRSQVDKGSRAYKDINLLAIKLLEPGGLLFTFSCSGHMEDALFQKIMADAAIDAGRELKIIRWLAQGPDHPVLASFPEGKYLKGIMARVE